MECAKVFIKPEHADRDLLDFRLLTFQAFVGTDRELDGSYEVRCIEQTLKAANARADMISSIVTNQGYGEVIRVEPAEEHQIPQKS